MKREVYYLKQIILYLIIILSISNSQNEEDYYGIIYAERQLNIEAMDPINARKTLDQFRYREIFNAYLWRFNAKFELEPNLVIAIPDRYEGKNDEFEIEIKENANWYNGEAITGHDIKFTFEVYRNLPHDPSGKTTRLKEIANAVKIDVNKDNDKIFIIKPFDIDKIKNFYKFIRFNIPFIQILPKEILKIKDIVEGSKFSLKPTGAGAFYIDYVTNGSNRLKQQNKNQVDFLRNEYYHLQNPRSLTSVTIRQESTLNGILNSFLISSTTREDKAFDLIIEELGSRNAINNLKNQPHVRGVQYARNAWMGLAINQDKELLKSKKFRLLLDEMIDDQNIVRNVYGSDASDITGPYLREIIMGGYDVSLLDRFQNNRNILLEKLKAENFIYHNNYLYYQNPINGDREEVEIRIIYNRNLVEINSREEEALKIIKSSLESYGITVKLEKLELSVFQDKINPQNNKYRDWDLAFIQHEAGWDSNVEYLFKKDGNKNYTHYNNEVLNNLFKNLLNSSGKTRKNIQKQIHRHCYDNLPYLFLWDVKPVCHMRKILDNVTITPGKFFTTIDEWEIEPRK